MSFKQQTKLEKFWIENFPLLFSLFVICFTYSPQYMGDIFFIKPFIVLILIYCWAINYCDDFSYGSVILCGFLEDIFDESLFGLNTICYLLFFYTTIVNRKYIAWKDFKYSWFGFGLLSLLVMTFKWLVISINTSAIISYGPTFISWILLSLLFPSLFLLTFNLYNRILGTNK